MALSIYEGRGRADPWPMYVSGINLAFAGICIGAWGFVALFVGEAVSWATWMPMSSRPEFLEYPFLLLWALPVGFSCLAWVSQKAGRDRLALGCAVMPVILFSLMIGWYWLAPIEWR
jgi:hypothetical protein